MLPPSVLYCPGGSSTVDKASVLCHHPITEPCIRPFLDTSPGGTAACHEPWTIRALDSPIPGQSDPWTVRPGSCGSGLYAHATRLVQVVVPESLTLPQTGQESRRRPLVLLGL